MPTRPGPDVSYGRVATVFQVNYVAVFIAATVTLIVGARLNAAVLAALVRAVGANSAGTDALRGIAVWVGFGVTFSAWPVIFARQPWDLWAVNNGAFLLMQVVMGAIVGAW